VTELSNFGIAVAFAIGNAAAWTWWRSLTEPTELAGGVVTGTAYAKALKFRPMPSELSRIEACVAAAFSVMRRTETAMALPALEFSPAAAAETAAVGSMALLCRGRPEKASALPLP